MRYLRRSAFLRLVVLPFTLSLWLSGCTSYVAMHPPYEQTIVSEQAGKVRVTLNDGSRLTINNPRIEADSLVWVAYDARDRAYTDTVHVAIEDVLTIEEVKTQGPSIAALVGAAALAGVLIAWQALWDWD